MKPTEAIALDSNKEAVKIPAKVKREINRAMRDRYNAAGLKAEMDSLNKGANETLLPIMAAYNIGTYKIEGLGVCNKKTTKGSKIDASQLLIGMLEAGLDSDTAKEIIEAASKYWSTEYVEFRRAK